MTLTREGPWTYDEFMIVKNDKRKALLEKKRADNRRAEWRDRERYRAGLRWKWNKKASAGGPTGPLVKQNGERIL